MFISLQQMWKESEWFHHQASWRIKWIINPFILFFTAIPQLYLRGQQSLTLSLNFFVSLVWMVVFCLFPDDVKRKIFQFCILIRYPKVLHWMRCNLFLLKDHIHDCWINITFSIHSKWSSWWSNSRLVITQQKSKIVLCELWSVSSLCLHWWEWEWDDDTVVYYGNHPVLQETHALHWKDCSKVFRFKNSGINHLCLMFFVKKSKIWRNGDHIVLRELCVYNKCIVKCAFKYTFIQKHRGEVKVL